MYGENEYLIAIDPGSTESGYVVVEHDGERILKVLDKGKIRNSDMRITLDYWCYEFEKWGEEHAPVAIEMVASYGMPVGRDVFETCLWIGRFIDLARCNGNTVYLIYRKDEKMEICGTMKAKDANIRHALIDEYAPGVPNDGKGRKAEPGFFYGFKADIWQAFAIAHTFLKLDSRGKAEKYESDPENETK